MITLHGIDSCDARAATAGERRDDARSAGKNESGINPLCDVAHFRDRNHGCTSRCCGTVRLEIQRRSLYGDTLPLRNTVARIALR
jgi:hypothetical protein